MVTGVDPRKRRTSVCPRYGYLSVTLGKRNARRTIGDATRSGSSVLGWRKISEHGSDRDSPVGGEAPEGMSSIQCQWLSPTVGGVD